MQRVGPLLFVAILLAVATPARVRSAAEVPAPTPKRVYVVPIREDIMPPLVYVVRRAVKEAIAAKADLIVLDMETNGGQVSATEQIIEILSQFHGPTVTYVNRNAYSAGAFISVATQKIYMAPESVIGAAAPVMMSPGGTGVEAMPEAIEIKATSAISAKVRAYAEKNGHNPEVVEAMIDRQKELILDGKTINRKGGILTLTDREASREYGSPSRPLLSLGTEPTLEALLAKLGYEGATVKRVEPTGAERLATWINALNWLWLILGAAGVYLEFKSPGFGLPGIVGICGFALYFLGGYIAGLSGLEWPLLFLIGLILVGVELLVFPGTIVPGLIGAALMFFTLVMAMVDWYPGTPRLPSLPQLELPLRDLALAAFGTVILLAILGKFLPRTPLYAALVAQSASGVESIRHQAATQASQVGRDGVALSPLRPGGKAQFGDDVLDVITQGELLEAGTRVRILSHSGHEAVVEPVVG